MTPQAAFDLETAALRRVLSASLQREAQMASTLDRAQAEATRLLNAIRELQTKYQELEFRMKGLEK